MLCEYVYYICLFLVSRNEEKRKEIVWWKVIKDEDEDEGREGKSSKFKKWCELKNKK